MNCANSIESHCNPPVNEQTSGTSANNAIMSYGPKSVCVYRVCLVKDHSVSFGENLNIANPRQAQAMLKHLILTRGQSDREQFVVALVNSKNDLIGFNIVSVGSLSAATVRPGEVLKPAILANAAAIILCHNHPSGGLQPSEADLSLTSNLIQATNAVGIQILDHLIVDLESDRYFSFADEGLIAASSEKAESKGIAQKIFGRVLNRTP